MVTPTIRELLARLNEVDESHEIEAKRSDSEVGKSSLETISAFANEPVLGGGYLLFGVVEDESSHRFVAKGVKDPKKLEQEISTLCASAFNRTIRPRVWTEVLDVVSLVAAFIPEVSSSEKPVFVLKQGMQYGAFRRIGSTDQRCTEDDLRAIFQTSSLTPYEDTVVEDTTMADLDPEVITAYRRSLIEENPANELRDASLDDLVQALGGARRADGKLTPTVAGVLLFGKKLSLRRVFPGARVDYIRVPGTEWVPNAEHRFESIEIREPLLIGFRRVYNAVVDDLPKSFSLEPGSPERKDRLVLPESAVREVIVNALTHRDYRVTNPTQVIRYQDRVEVRNAGYSLADADQLGEPGSFPRNMHIADVFREMRLAENKGTGITAVRRAMDRAGLTPPVFDSDRSLNRFVATLWMHNLISAEESEWLQSLPGVAVSDAQARALVVARRTGSVTNAILRDVSGLDTLAASVQLRQLCESGLLERRGKSVATHYVIGLGQASADSVDRPNLPPDRPNLDPDRPNLPADRPNLPADRPKLSADRPNLPADRPNLPGELDQTVKALGDRPRQEPLREAIEALCRWRPLSAEKLGQILRVSAHNLSKRHLSPTVAAGRLVRTHPENPNHPAQAYRAAGEGTSFKGKGSA
jgi:ATP-dependent DNA helicase RecG